MIDRELGRPREEAVLDGKQRARAQRCTCEVYRGPLFELFQVACA